MRLRLLIFFMMTMVVTMTAGAQDVKELYKQGKAFYDAKNYTQAFPLLKKAAEKGHKKAQYRLGRCYDKGNGVTENNETAFKWYSKSAAQGYADAQYQLGRCYLKGKGTAVDKKKAKSWLSKAVKDPKEGDKILQKIQENAKEGDEDAKAILQLLR